MSNTTNVELIANQARELYDQKQEISRLEIHVTAEKEYVATLRSYLADIAKLIGYEGHPGSISGVLEEKLDEIIKELQTLKGNLEVT